MMVSRDDYLKNLMIDSNWHCKFAQAIINGLSMYPLEEHERDCDTCQADKEITRLQAALEDMFAMLDEGVLVRDISNDASDTFTMDMLAFVQRLAACKQALKGLDDDH